MSAGDPIPDPDHLLLHCTKSKFTLEVDPNGEPAGITPDAFRCDDNGISMNWLEFQPGTAEERFAAICAIFRQRDIRPNHRLAQFVVGAIRQVGDRYGRAVNAIEDPIGGNPAHALVTGVSQDDEELRMALTTAVAAIRKLAPAAGV